MHVWILYTWCRGFWWDVLCACLRSKGCLLSMVDPVLSQKPAHNLRIAPALEQCVAMEVWERQCCLASQLHGGIYIEPWRTSTRLEPYEPGVLLQELSPVTFSDPESLGSKNEFCDLYGDYDGDDPFGRDHVDALVSTPSHVVTLEHIKRQIYMPSYRSSRHCL